MATAELRAIAVTPVMTSTVSLFGSRLVIGSGVASFAKAAWPRSVSRRQISPRRQRPLRRAEAVVGRRVVIQRNGAQPNAQILERHDAEAHRVAPDRVRQGCAGLRLHVRAGRPQQGGQIGEDRLVGIDGRKVRRRARAGPNVAQLLEGDAPQDGGHAIHRDEDALPGQLRAVGGASHPAGGRPSAFTCSDLAPASFRSWRSCSTAWPGTSCADFNAHRAARRLGRRHGRRAGRAPPWAIPSLPAPSLPSRQGQVRAGRPRSRPGRSRGRQPAAGQSLKWGSMCSRREAPAQTGTTGNG